MTVPLLVAASLANAQTGPPSEISGPEINTLIHTAIIAAHHANISGNYTVLRDISARAIRDKFSAADLGDFFRVFQEKKIDLSPTVLIDPILTKKIQVSPKGVLSVVGYFPAQPYHILFDMQFVNEQKVWKILKIEMKTK